MSTVDAQVGTALVDFVTKDTYPEDEAVFGAQIDVSGLPDTYKVLDAARLNLEADIRTISRETAPNVDAWIANAQALQTEIEQLRKFANNIVQEAEADQERIQAVEDEAAHSQFLETELVYNEQLKETLRAIQKINTLVDDAETQAGEGEILKPLELLAESWRNIQYLPIDKSTRVVRLLDTRCFELKEALHDRFLEIWRALMHIDPEKGTFTIHKQLEGVTTTLDQSIIILQSYKELDKQAKKLWEDFYNCIMKPRMDFLRRDTLFAIDINLFDGTVTLLDRAADSNIRPLFRDIMALVDMLCAQLPMAFLEEFASAMMLTLGPRITEDWLDNAVPVSLEEMVDYQKTLAQVHEFLELLTDVKWPGLGPFDLWVSNAPKIWLSKRRETALDYTRNQLALGVGEPLAATHIETRMVPKNETLIDAPGVTVQEDWNSDWGSDEQNEEQEKENTEPTPRNRESLDEEQRVTAMASPDASPIDEEDAWGLTSDDDEPEPKPKLASLPDLVEKTYSEPLYISSIPKTLFDSILSIYEDGARLMSPESEAIPIAPAAPSLFGLPTLILAMYRAVSPYHYSRDLSGNMFTYNDAMWLCDRLKTFASDWQTRKDLPPRALGLVKLDPEIRALDSFGKRAYTNELVDQRQIINDMMNGAQSFFQDTNKVERDQGIKDVLNHIRETSTRWKKILPYSAWASAVGSIVNAVATKIIADVFDLSDIGVNDAEWIAQLIATVTELDDLFIDERSRTNGTAPISADHDDTIIYNTPRFADKWLKMKFLSEVLQSNLKDIRYLWFESELSLYFTKEETVDLITLSFEDNVNVRALIREIKASTRGE